MSEAEAFEERLRRLIGTEGQLTCPSWAATSIIFVSGMIVGVVVQHLRVPMPTKENLSLRKNQWPTR